MRPRRPAAAEGRAGRGPGAGSVRFATRPQPRPVPARRPLLSARATVAVALLVTLVVAAGYAVLATSLLGLRTVEVRGSSAVSTAQVRAALGIAPGAPLARVQLAESTERVEGIRAVRSATVTRKWPHTLVVTVRDRVPVAVVANGSGWSYVDATGAAFAPAPAAEAKDPLGHPLLRTRRGDLGALRSAAAVVASLPEALLVQVTRVDAKSADSVTLALRNRRSLVWGDPNRAARKASVAVALMTSVKDGTTFDVSAPDAPTVR